MKILTLIVPLLVLTNLTTPIHAVDFSDAELLALEISGELLAPPDLVAAIEQDLAAIYAVNPYLAELRARPAWMPGQIIVKLTDDALLDYQAGEYHDLDDLNATHGLISDRIISGSWLLLGFAEPLHPVVLGALYAEVESVIQSEANGLVGDGDDIIATEVGHYTFKHGWGDCPAGCLKEHFWVYTVQDGLVELIDEHGDEFSAASESKSWGSLKSRF
jgi:hypothetical protein